MYKHIIERADFDSQATNFLDGYLNDGWTLLSHTVYASERGKDFTRSSSEYQHVLVFQKYASEDSTMSKEELSIFDEMAVESVFGNNSN